MDLTETEKPFAFMSCFLVVQAMKAVRKKNMVKLRRVFIAIAGNGHSFAVGRAFGKRPAWNCSRTKLQKMRTYSVAHLCSVL
jgi:hypothetical protein